MKREIPRQLIRRLENLNFPLLALGAVHELRTYLNEIENEAIPKALELGANAEDLAEALGITRQGAYYKIKALEKRTNGGPGDVDDMPELNGEPAGS